MTSVQTSPAPTGSRSTGATVGFAAAAMLVSYLPFSGANGVLGTIGADLSSSTAELTGVTDAFTVALVVALLAGGAAGQRRGHRLVAVCGLGLTALGSLLGFLAPSVQLLWGAQAVAGAGAGLVMAATLALITATAPSPADRTRAISLWAAANVVGLGAGPFVAGAAAQLAGWRWLYPPVVLLALGVAVLGLARARETPADPRAGLLPRLSPRLLASTGFDAAGLAAATALFTVIGVVLVCSLTLARAGVSELGVATVLGCLFAGNAAASVACGPLQLRLGSRRVLVGGLLVTLLGLLLLLDGTSTPVDLAWRLAVVGLGAGTVVATSTAVAVQSVPAPLMGQAGTANNVVRQLGGALGAAVVGGLALTTATGVLLVLVAVTTVLVAALLARRA